MRQRLASFSIKFCFKILVDGYNSSERGEETDPSFN